MLTKKATYSAREHSTSVEECLEIISTEKANKNGLALTILRGNLSVGYQKLRWYLGNRSQLNNQMNFSSSRSDSQDARIEPSLSSSQEKPTG